MFAWPAVSSTGKWACARCVCRASAVTVTPVKVVGLQQGGEAGDFIGLSGTRSRVTAVPASVIAASRCAAELSPLREPRALLPSTARV